jgi:hypothetical protein
MELHHQATAALIVAVILRNLLSCANEINWLVGWKMVLRIAFPKSFRELGNGYSGASLHGAQAAKTRRTFRFTNAEMQTSGATHLVNRTR